jgi:hypothetical protein
MIPTIQNWAKGVYQSYSSLREDEVGAKLWKVALCAPALLALGAQTFGSLPLQPVIVTIVIADAVFHCIAVRSPQLCKKAKKYEWAFYGVRLATLTWSVGHLFKAMSAWTTIFPLTATSILRTYSTHHPDYLISINGGPFKTIYSTHPFDWWTLSWPVAIGMRKLVDRVHLWIGKDELSREVLGNLNVKIESAEQSLPKAPLWVAVLQQVIYVSLAIFSKSRLVFAGLSVFNLYIFYESFLYTRACLRQILITVWFNRSFKNERQCCFRYKELFAVQENAKKEVSAEIMRLSKEAETFQPFNLQQSEDGKWYSICTQTMPTFVSEQSPLKQISDRQFYISEGWTPSLEKHQKIECRFQLLDYKEGKEISVPIQGVDKGSKILRVPLRNEVIVDFPNTCTSQILKMKLEGKTISAKIEATKVEKGQLYLSCNSIDLPKAEKLAFEWQKNLCEISFNLKATVDICETGKTQARCSGCSSASHMFYYESCDPCSAVCKSCIKTDFENRVKKFTIVNELLREIWNNGSYFVYKVYAQKEQLPEGSTLSMKALDGRVDISWLDYPVGEKVKVRLQRLNDQGTAIGELLDKTLVCLQDVSPEKAEKMIQAQTTIEAQIIAEEVDQDRLILDCISRALPPRSMPIFTTALLELGDGTPVKLEYKVNCKPKASNQDEECTICESTSEMLFYACADERHTTCILCLGNHFKVQYNRVHVVNCQQITVTSPEGWIKSSYHRVCLDNNSLPDCMHCRFPVVDKSRLSVWVGNMEAKVLLLNYKIDDIVRFKIEGFFQNRMPYGKLNNGTLVTVTNLQLSQSLSLQASQTPIDAKILQKTVENGQLCLTCEFIAASNEPFNSSSSDEDD